ncbi:MAG: hypothetical protein GXY50_02360 [Syntrophomonadaceae bacterium]|nr:hypothetical protein [Syntrophomonadaceae bacterium]
MAEKALSNWEPLMNTLMGLFMFMGCATFKGDQIYLYKHIWTRRYLNLDGKGQAYQFENGVYKPVSMPDALSHAFS